jgi:hypothetical protein
MKSALYPFFWIMQSGGVGWGGGDTDGMRRQTMGQNLFVDRSFSFNLVHLLHLELRTTVSQHRFFCSQCFTQSLQDSWALNCRNCFVVCPWDLHFSRRGCTQRPQICKTRRVTQPWWCFFISSSVMLILSQKTKSGRVVCSSVLVCFPWCEGSPVYCVFNSLECSLCWVMRELVGYLVLLVTDRWRSCVIQESSLLFLIINAHLLEFIFLYIH